jgi:protein-disulfide isomerase
MAYGEKVGVRSTPTFFINGQLINGALPVESFSEIIDDELAAKK